MGWFSVSFTYTSGYFPWLGLFQVPSLARIEGFSRCKPRNSNYDMYLYLRISQARLNTYHQHVLTLDLFPLHPFIPQSTYTFSKLYPLLCKAHNHSSHTLFTAASIAWICTHSFFLCHSQRPLYSLLDKKCLADPRCEKLCLLRFVEGNTQLKVNQSMF